ncbi:MAG: D-alanyl-D-alanine dipeptidase [Segetibacter sp.]|nr:D-alanyl-D-alanine dipeptidase [Segetibacter sp.]
MRGKSKAYALLNLLIVAILFHSEVKCQHINSRINEYGLNILSGEKAFKTEVCADTNKHMINLQLVIPNIITDWRYATLNNFTKKILYKHPEPFLRLPAAKALAAVQAELEKQGIGLKIFDAYRPYQVTKQMWEIVPDARYAANPAKGSGHNRGAAVDVTLVDLKTRKELPMPTDFDDFSEKANHAYMQLDKTVLANRELLKSTMEKHGFLALDTEWWHYFLPNAAQRFELMDLSFKQMRRVAKKRF